LQVAGTDLSRGKVTRQWYRDYTCWGSRLWRGNWRALWSVSIRSSGSTRHTW